MKAIIHSSDESNRYTFRVPLAEFLDAVLTEDQRENFRSHEVDVFVDASTAGGPDDTLSIHFKRTIDYEADHEGHLVEISAKRLHHCVSKAELALVEARLEGKLAELAHREDNLDALPGTTRAT